jgi:hypothetical protein
VDRESELAVKLDLTEAANAVRRTNDWSVDAALKVAAPHIIAAFVASLADDEALVEAVAGALDVHQIEYIDPEVGYICGCDEAGELHLPFLSDAQQHQARAALQAVAEHYARDAT